ncbi:hypothetical protein, variant [Aphanomyces astaci]|uniref:Uncharacterized protein n=1 Tax=Aphanomyces astaci TaxID=112090 RepID=W4HB77_APHAT|nr:hypothetical protein, variant [Aphanomyces astaci]ETV88524.1 hypothetical protein, variant [Aphanomyces astaci]|eukprot:XP_009820924.1 hypothetical protein, variant [Aphanomyces astaci]
MDRTTEKLRSKHVRTLELLQKTLDENAEMKDKLVALTKSSSASSFQLSMGQGVSLADRLQETELELERLKARHAIALQQQAEAAAEALEATKRLVEQHVLDKKFNMTSNVEVAQRIRQQSQVQELQAAQTATVALTEAKQRAEDSVSRSMEAKRVAEVECVRLTDLVERMRKNERTYTSQVESLKAQTLVFEAEHNQVYQKLDARDRQVEMMQQELAELRQKARSNADAMSIELKMASEQADKLVKATQQRTTTMGDDGQRTSNLLSNNCPNDSSSSHNQSLARENQTLRDQVAQLRADLETVCASKSGFATHVDLKKENFLLRQQVEEMQGLQKKFLATAKKTTIMASFGNQRG